MKESWLDKIWRHIDDGQIVRRIAFFGMMWMTYQAYMWVMAYVETIDKVGIEHAAVIGAVLGPISGLQGAIIKFYAENPYHYSHEGLMKSRAPAPMVGVITEAPLVEPELKEERRE